MFELCRYATGYSDEDDEEVTIYNSWMIAKHYSKTWLFIDIVACLPIDIVLRIMEGRMGCSLNQKGCPPKAVVGLYKL